MSERRHSTFVALRSRGEQQMARAFDFDAEHPPSTERQCRSREQAPRVVARLHFNAASSVRAHTAPPCSYEIDPHTKSTSVSLVLEKSAAYAGNPKREGRAGRCASKSRQRSRTDYQPEMTGARSSRTTRPSATFCVHDGAACWSRRSVKVWVYRSPRRLSERETTCRTRL